MATIDERNERFFKQEGLIAIRQRIRSWIDLYNKNVFPITAQMLGFGNFTMKSKEECLNRIKELSELIGHEIQIRTERIAKTNGEIIMEEIITE